MKKRKQHIGILTWYNHGNYGSALQAYALQTTIKRMGYDVEIVQYIMQWRRCSSNVIKRIKICIKKFLAIVAESFPSLFKRRINHFQYFYYKYIFFSKPCDEKSINKVIDKYDKIIVGSDQIWSPLHLDPIYLLTFCTSKQIKKVAYAPSIGIEDIPDDMRPLYRQYLTDFNKLSIREKSGADILLSLGFQCPVVLDPTFLLCKDDYISIEHYIDLPFKDYVFCYFLSTKDSYKEAVLEYATSHSLKIVGISANEDDYAWLERIQNIGPCEFIWLIHHAHTVITNSYHGTIFSMILGTPYYTYRRFDVNDPICQNTRIEQLIRDFAISSYILNSGETIPINETRHRTEYEKYSKPLIENSLYFLNQSIVCP